MKTLILLRHAKSSWKDPYLSDHDRPLNARGKRDAPAMAELLADRLPKPDYVLCSTSRRTRDTADYFIKILGIGADQVEYDRELYHADGFTLLHAISQCDNSVDTLLVIGHNPGITVLANLLQPGITDNIPTAGIVVFESKERSWATFLNKEDIHCTGYYTPKEG
jgi:phosphohistidine phosphatase